MKHVYYFFWMLFLVYEILWLSSAKEHIKNTLVSKLWFKENKLSKIDYKEWPSEVKTSCFLAFAVSLPVMMLKVIGLMSFQWFAFLLWLGVSLTVMLFDKIIGKSETGLLSLNVLVTIVNIGFILFVVLNNYHFQMLPQSYFGF